MITFKKQAIIGTIFFSLCAQASTIDSVRENFFNHIGEKRQKSVIALLQNDKNYIKAIEYLTNPTLMLTLPSVEFHGQKMDERKMPDCKKALPFLVESFKITHNTLSAYLGLHCINNDTLFGKKDVKALEAKRMLAEGLFINEKLLCSGYIDYGTILIDGIAGVPDLEKAEKVFNEAKIKCYPSASDWEKRVIENKLEQIALKERLAKNTGGLVAKPPKSTKQ